MGPIKRLILIPLSDKKTLWISLNCLAIKTLELRKSIFKEIWIEVFSHDAFHC